MTQKTRSVPKDTYGDRPPLERAPPKDTYGDQGLTQGHVRGPPRDRPGTARSNSKKIGQNAEPSKDVSLLFFRYSKTLLLCAKFIIKRHFSITFRHFSVSKLAV